MHVQIKDELFALKFTQLSDIKLSFPMFLELANCTDHFFVKYDQ